MVHPATGRDQRFTYGDYRTWPEDERWELIDGISYAMSPAPLRIHADISRDLFLQIARFFEEKPCRVYHAPFDVRLPKRNEADEEIDTVVQPDILVVCDEEKLDDKGCRGAPDLIIEVLSPATASRDHIIKRTLYENHGVKEYWLVSPTDRIVTLYRLEPDGRFGRSLIYADTEVIEVALFPDLKIDLRKVFPPQESVVRERPARHPDSKER